jgi:hypothetical protein
MTVLFHAACRPPNLDGGELTYRSQGVESFPTDSVGSVPQGEASRQWRPQMTFARSSHAAMRTLQRGVLQLLLDALIGDADFEAPTSIAGAALRRPLLRC